MSDCEKPVTSQRDHPEAQPGEVAIGNIWASDFLMIGWASRRLGKMSYDATGKHIPNFKPVFVLRSEIEAAAVSIPDLGPVDHRWQKNAVETSSTKHRRVR